MFVFFRKLLARNPISLVIWRVLQFPYPYRVALVEIILLIFTRTRPHYYSALFEAATLAKRLGIPKISTMEFGVAGGAGLIALERHARRVSRATSVMIEVYGFDMVSGLPKPKDYRDMPYAWQEGYFKSDRAWLQARLDRARLIEGNIADTLPAFLEQERPAPVGFIAVDVDYYSSTLATLGLFDGNHERYLPRVICYFDDLGNGNIFNGEHAAIETFNQSNATRKIARHESFYSDFIYGRKAPLFFTMHDFDHPRYSEYTGFAAHTVDQDRIRG